MDIVQSWRRRVLVVFAVAVVACSGPSVRPDVAEKQVHRALPPGAEGWNGGALLLPRGAPAVLEARPDQLMSAARRFKAWIVAEPAMLGPDGEETVRTIEFAWGQIESYLGVDPLDPSTWREGGLDTRRPIYVAPYPIAETGSAFLAAVDRQVRAELGVPPGGDVREALHTLVATAGALPEGTNSRVLRAVEGARPVGGLRIVVPVTASIDLMATLTRFAESAGFQPFSAELVANLGLSPLEGAFWSSGIVPAFAMRGEGSHVVIDVVAPAFLGGAVPITDPETDLDGVYEDLRLAIETIAFGRPSAPRAADQPALAVSFDQTRTGGFVKLRGYREVLGSLGNARAEKRDELLLQGLLLAGDDAANWLVGAATVPGLAYAAHVSGPNSTEVGRASMVLFGARELPPIPEANRYPSLGIQDRSAAIGVTLESTRSQPWRAWFDPATSRQISAVNTEGVPPMRVILPGARVLALALAQVGNTESSTHFFPDLIGDVEDLQKLRRIEVVGLTPDVGDLRLNPQLVVATILEPGADVASAATEARDAVIAAVTRFGPPSTSAAELPAVVAGSVQTIVIEGMPSMTSRLEASGDHPYLLVGVGVEPAVLEREVAAMKLQQSAATILSARLEPISFLSWLRLDDAKMFEPIDLDILAQRLGPLLLDLAPRTIGSSSALSIEVVLRAPPRL